MAKVEIKNLNSVFNSVRAIFDKSIKQDSFLKGVGEFILNRITAETRKGRDLTNEGSPIKKHSGYYTEIRDAVQKGALVTSYPTDERFFRVKKSNITFTGQLLDSLKVSVDKSDQVITVEPTGSRSTVKFYIPGINEEIKLFKGEPITDNKELTRSLASRGFTFLGIDTLGIKRVRKMILDELRRQIRLRK